MDLPESTKIVSSRVLQEEPENALKIVGYLLLHDYGGQDMIRLAFSPDNVIKTVINKAKEYLGLSPSKHQQLAYTPMSPPLNIPIQYSNHPHQDFCETLAFANSDMPINDWSHAQVPINSLEDQLLRSLKLDEDYSDFGNGLGSGLSNNYCYPNQSELCGFGIHKGSRRSRSLSDFPPKICHYFSRGFCKHGNNCRFFHGCPTTIERFSQSYGLRSSYNGNENGNENDERNVFPIGTLERLEVDLVELLRSRKGIPISIASLPMLYYEKFGRTLQAEGYLTESQRHGKAGYSLTKLLARLKKSICLIDRPHGQHSVILAEDASKYLYCAAAPNEHGTIVHGSRQIYLTFPAESEFTETDVSNYFNTYGPVQDVRIPNQVKRMFGFVTFIYSETARKVVAMGNPHNVCGARVLVKPYKEKSRLIDRRHTEKLQRSMRSHSQQFDGDPEFHSMPRTKLMRKQFVEEHRSTRHQYSTNSNDEFDQEFPTLEKFDFELNSVNNHSSKEDTPSYYGSWNESQVLNLPDNPFATSTPNSI